MKKIVFISIEVKSRELNSQLLLTYYLIKKNYKIYIGSVNSIIYLLKKIKSKSGIYLYKGGQEKEINKLVKKKCFSHVVIDQELGITVKNFDHKIEKRFFKDQLSYIDRFYCIGNNAYNSAKNYFLDTGCKPILSGWPRVDLWKQSYRYLYIDKINKIREKYGKFILFSSDFGFLSENSIKERIRDLDWNNNIKEHNKFKFIQEKRDQVKFNLEDFRNFLKFLEDCDNNLNIPTIIVRPHPAENIFVWRQVLKKYKKTYVVFEGDISHWLYASICLLHRGCTTSVQAKYSNIHSLFFGHKRSDINNIPYDISIKIKSSIDLEKQIKLFENTNLSNNNISKITDDVVFMGDKDASEIIADDLDSVTCEVADDINLTILNRIMIDLKLKIIKFKTIIRILLNTVKFFSLNTLSTYLLKLEGKIYKDEIKSTLKNIAIVKKDDIKFNIKKICENLYQITK